MSESDGDGHDSVEPLQLPYSDQGPQNSAAQTTGWSNQGFVLLLLDTNLEDTGDQQWLQNFTRLLKLG